MKIKQLFEHYAEVSLDEWFTDEIINIVKEECAPFINEFLKNNTFVYRGLDNIQYDYLHLVETLPYREVHGTAFSNNDMRESFEKYLKEKGVSRYKNSVSTITFSPDEYEGISIDSWFYFIPRETYKYHYYKDIENGDINIDNRAFENLRKIGFALGGIELEYQDLSDLIEDHSKDELETIFDPHEFNTIQKMMHDTNEAMSLLSDLFMISNKQYEFIENYAKKLDLFLRHTDLDNEESDGILESLHVIGSKIKLLVYEDMMEDINLIKDLVVVNQIPEENSEVVFTCKDYYVIPYSKQGMEFIKELIK